MYDPGQGRWMQQDPLSQGQGDWTYATSSPANAMDPSGMDAGPGEDESGDEEQGDEGLPPEYVASTEPRRVRPSFQPQGPEGPLPDVGGGGSGSSETGDDSGSGGPAISPMYPERPPGRPGTVQREQPRPRPLEPGNGATCTYMPGILLKMLWLLLHMGA